MPTGSSVIVFGSINVDLAMRVQRTPQRGETVLTRDAAISAGGKGANQANAAGRFGARVAMFGAVGEDDLATTALATLRATGVDLSGIRRSSGAVTGCAAIWVDAEGGNTIAVASGANWLARQSDVPDAALAKAKVLLLQNEVPADENWALAARAHRAGCKVIYNNAPAAAVPAHALVHMSLLVVNEVEACQTAAALGLTAADPEAAARGLAGAYGLTVMLTLGEAGSVAIGQDDVVRQAALSIKPVDTTAAGDTFSGVLGAAIAEGEALASAMRLASAAASLACTRAGAQPSQPDSAEVLAAAKRIG